MHYQFTPETLLRAHNLVLKHINSHKGLSISLQELANAHGKAIAEYCQAREPNIEWPMNKIMGLMLENLDLEEHFSSDEFSDLYKFNDHDVRLMETTSESIPELKKLGKLGIISNLPHNSLKYELMAHGLYRAFDPIVISYEVGYRKPHPAIYREALKRAVISPEQAVFFSHDQEEVDGALAVGMQGHLAKSLAEVLTKLKTS